MTAPITANVTAIFAQMSKAFVISACGTVDERMIEILNVDPEGEQFLRNAGYCGGSLIVNPMSRIIAGPMGPEEGILYADCDLEFAIQMKLRHDFAGHYNRPDILQIHVNRAAPQLYHAHNEELPQPLATDSQVCFRSQPRVWHRPMQSTVVAR